MNITPRRLMAALAASGTALLTVAAPAQAQAAPLVCPTGFESAPVSDLAAAGYWVALLVDDPASGVQSYGRAANGNGFICLRAMGNRTTHFGGQYYLFTDDGLRHA